LNIKFQKVKFNFYICLDITTLSKINNLKDHSVFVSLDKAFLDSSVFLALAFSDVKAFKAYFSSLTALLTIKNKYIYGEKFYNRTLVFKVLLLYKDKLISMGGFY
jgi:hypothetical protein